ncbi:hypothetical protein [Algibacter sp. PT7-4]|uniref:hypothetical protein n=1 Tax=Algibacter ulvanivorans TaxID=3400999 RepID=UPI003AAD36C8
MSTTDFVLVLGSGKSILNLTQDEKQKLESCSVKLAVNKFSAFYDKSGITPTHIYFEDRHDISSVLMLKYIFKRFRKEKKNPTFIVSEFYKNLLFKNSCKFNFIKLKLKFKTYTNLFLVKLGRKTLKPISVNLFNKYVYLLAKVFITKPHVLYNLVSKGSEIQFIDIIHCENKKKQWAKTLNDPLFHFKGSFSSVLNYISICFPNKTILLVGVDFNSSDYFFEEELNKLDFKTSDWTYDLRKKHNKHYSVIQTDGVKMDDAMPFMLEKLKETNNKIYSINENSYLVEKGFVKKIDI